MKASTCLWPTLILFGWNIENVQNEKKPQTKFQNLFTGFEHFFRSQCSNYRVNTTFFTLSAVLGHLPCTKLGDSLSAPELPVTDQRKPHGTWWKVWQSDVIQHVMTKLRWICTLTDWKGSERTNFMSHFYLWFVFSPFSAPLGSHEMDNTRRNCCEPNRTRHTGIRKWAGSDNHRWNNENLQSQSYDISRVCYSKKRRF